MEKDCYQEIIAEVSKKLAEKFQQKISTLDMAEWADADKTLFHMLCFNVLSPDNDDI
jgi:hypothetical protein